MKEKENYSIFEYNPQGGRLRLVTDEELLYDFNTKEFCINQNPMGEGKLGSIFDVEISDDFHNISFTTIYRKNEKKIIMNYQNRVDSVIYNFFSKLHKHEFDVQENDIDHIIIKIRNDVIYEIEIYKNDKDYELLDSLTIVSKNKELYFETFEPEYVQTKIKNIEFTQNKFLITTETEIEEYIVDSQSIILNLIKDLIDNSVVM
jgi:hypothetical protein